MGSSKRYTREEILTGLTCYAMVAGSEVKTLEMLKQAKMGRTPIATVRDWAYRTYRDDYEAIKADIDQHVRSRLADKHLELAESAVELESRIDDELRALLDAGELGPKELVDIKRTAATSSGIHTDKYQLTSGKPTQIVQNDFSELQKALLQRHGVTLTIEGEATEEPIQELQEATT